MDFHSGYWVCKVIETFTPTAINCDSLNKWVERVVAPMFPESMIGVIADRPWDATGESKFFCVVDVDRNVTLDTLKEKIVIEHSRGLYIHFYARDIVSAAANAGELQGNYFWMLYEW